MFRRQCQDKETSPSSRQPAGNLPFDNSHESDDSDTGIESNCPAIITDVVGLQLGLLPRKESRWLVNDIDISEKWHLFKEKSLELANKKGLFLESHIFFSFARLLRKIIILYCIEEITRDNAVSELQILLIGRSFGECAVLKAIRNIIERVPRATLKSPIGEMELCTTYIDPILSPLFMDPDRGIFLLWSNKEVAESKARKPIGRAKQPDAIINKIDQLSWGLSKGCNKAKVQEESNNLYLLCTDLIRVAVFNKDAIDFYNMNWHHITFYLTTLLCDALYVMVEVFHIDVSMSLEQ
ncbi:16607_t:CDS:2, partial [Cetraspora pellucida]